MTEYTQTVLGPWVAALEARLELPEGSVDVPAVLDLARDAAHHVARPAAPVTGYLVGYAAGVAAARGESSDALARATELVLGWQPETAA